jgi:NAD(P)H-dependent FMN reductase
MILVVNGSPQPQGNLHRLLEKIAGGTGKPYELVHLADLTIGPCKGCVECAPSNVCVQPDDMAPLYDRIVAADALIVGGAVYFGRLNALTHTFLERLYPLRHRLPRTMGKLAAAVCVGAIEAETVVQEISEFLEKYFYYRLVGSVYFNSATPPCYVCGFGDTCQYGLPAMMLSPQEFARFKVTPELFRRFEDVPEVVAACASLSRDLVLAIDSLSQE